MIVATAGHVDHGKTSLVRSLTGVDTDRLAEEKRRGMSIELGFAYADFAGARIGFVDVPGHERFVRNMLAGVAAIDFALLVIAADDGPMPQTREHVAILDLLGVKRGAVALTKIDRVAETRIAEVRGQIAGLLAPTGLANAPVFPVVATDETSIGALRQHLGIAENAADIKPADGYFRLAVDRAFVLPGIGLIATGAVFAGEARVGDRLTVSPLGKSVRLRSIRTQDRPSEIARAGDRAALNIAGDVERAELQRGDWIVAPEVHAPADRIDVRLHVLPGEARALAHWTPVHVHLGAADVTGRVAVLEGRSIAPGTQGLAQLVLDQPAGALTHDRFVLRDQSALRTIAGGMVLDPFAPARGRSKPHRLAALAAHS
ncbi:MAG TPA: selenocysteine-specific translation elongation factor, partial [Candidatus Cybelea sp.]|nr:selenocysteine-specific translation elongation factor [Candidatus Cybelea sp.]